MKELKNYNFDNGISFSADGARRQVSKRIRQLRLLAGWSQREMARRVSMPEVTYRLFEKNGHIQLDRLCRMAMVLGRLGDFGPFLEPPQFASVKDFEMRQKRKYGKTIKNES